MTKYLIIVLNSEYIHKMNVNKNKNFPNDMIEIPV